MISKLSPLFKASALALAATIVSAAPALADDYQIDYQIDDQGIATCSGNGGARASRGELATSLANQFWSRMACGRWEEAFDVLEDAPSSPIDMLPNAYALGVNPLNDCYFNSFAYGPRYHDVTVRAIYGEDNQLVSQAETVGHGFYEFDLEEFQKIQAAMLWQCQPIIS